MSSDSSKPRNAIRNRKWIPFNLAFPKEGLLVRVRLNPENALKATRLEHMVGRWRGKMLYQCGETYSYYTYFSHWRNEERP
ncbi:MAG TPA: hypothetical protein VGQ12_07540 [Candidatus Angelobacter sp.]|nr:hypothetical protein [Candidatus Angelobacter sp.]